MEACKKTGIKTHPARFPIQIPLFFVRFLTDPSDLVLDPFAGSNTTGKLVNANPEGGWQLN
jgi:site-specific DNA-methyltransferase (cytosine-N4-specific)